jgi:hypothetical protein
MAQALSFEHAPPLSVPLRFLLTAPVFAMAAGGVLLAGGPAALASRWSPVTAAATHLLTIGFLAMVIFGAMLQMSAVLAGTAVRRPRVVAGVVHLLAVAGVVLLAAGLGRRPVLLPAAAAMLGGAFLVFGVAMLAALGRARSGGASLTGMRLATLGLIVTAVLGVIAALERSGMIATGWSAPGLTGAHLAWGIVGGAGMLVAGVAFQVVPMFQVTEDYPAWLQRLLPPGLFAAVLGTSAALLAPLPALLVVTFEWLLALAVAAFALATLILLARRRRRIPDATHDFWRLAMASAFAAAILWASRAWWPDGPAFALAIGLLALLGALQSVVNAMLYKIVPFLCWLHLQRAGVRGGATMRDLLPERSASVHFAAHFAALALLLGALRWPELIYPGASLYLLGYAWCEFSLAGCVWRYRGLLSRPPVPATREQARSERPRGDHGD